LFEAPAMIFQYNGYIWAVEPDFQGWTLIDYGTDASTVIQAAIDSGAKKIIVREGSYDIYTGLTISPNNVIFEGMGIATELVSHLGVGEDVISVPATASGRKGIAITRLRIEGNGSERHAIFISDTLRDYGISEIEIAGVGGDGIHVEGCFSYNIFRNRIAATNIGIYVNASASFNSHAIKVYANTITSTIAQGIYVTGNPSGVMVYNNDLTEIDGHGIEIDRAGHVQVVHNYIEAAGGDGIYVGTDAGGSNTPQILGNFITNPVGNGITLDHQSRGKVFFNGIGAVGGSKVNITANSLDAFIEERYGIADAGTNTVRIRNYAGIFQVETGQGLGFPVYTNATRPAAGTAGRAIWNSDDNMLNIDDGTNWRDTNGNIT
jgi:hypothetical protein